MVHTWAWGGTDRTVSHVVRGAERASDSAGGGADPVYHSQCIDTTVALSGLVHACSGPDIARMANACSISLLIYLCIYAEL